ncbi:MAG: right-handed parallel beta-helix repeat-containing protein [Nitrososphaeraceae archaeon]|nr:right-handed parallel beta-helix repeat-containing protein [Nitrososphaeraceae archaeon]
MKCINKEEYACIFLLLSLLFLLPLSSQLEIVLGDVKAQPQRVLSTNNNTSCIKYNAAERLITVSCKSATLTDIYNQLKNPDVLDKDPQQQGVWLLNANITIDKGSTLTIDPTDTTWLKILTDGKTLAYGIHVVGSLKIDSVRLTSWNPQTNYYGINAGSRESSGPATAICGSNCPIEIKDKLTHHGAPRGYIRIEYNSAGTTNITNSYIGYIGYEAGWGKMTPGLQYNAGNGSVIRNNEFDHLYFGFYSVNVGYMTLENNIIHDSGHYGIDPHTGTHDMLIRNNTVYNNNGTAIICSLNCNNITFENNNVSNNHGSGITFSRNTTNSVARNNYVHNQLFPIEISSSYNNAVYNNTISNTNTTGIYVIGDSSGNKIYNNTIMNAHSGITMRKNATNNMISDNKIIGVRARGTESGSSTTNTILDQ